MKPTFRAMKRQIYTLFFLVFPLFLSAQEDLILNSGFDEENQFVISAEKNEPGTQYVEIEISNLKNASEYRIGMIPIVVESSGELLAIPPIDRETTPEVQYSYVYWQGNPLSNPDRNFVYRLPYSERKVRSIDSPVVQDPKHEYNKHWHTIQFNMERGDTIYAARSGEVIRVKTAENTSNHTNRGSLTIEHKDGSFADYSVMETVFVRPGEHVYPHTAIGLAGSNDGQRYQTRLAVYYHRLPRGGKTYPNAKFENHYLRPVFQTNKGVKELEVSELYIPVVPLELIIREMSKREVRRQFGEL